MKIRKRELAHPGIFGTVENPLVVTGRDLREIAETFPDIKKAPVLLGHDGDPKAPRLGYVRSVTYDEKTKTLVGDIVETDVMSKAVDDGYYPDCSIGARRRSLDGKMYLHHLAYLGEEPPAIKDLAAEAAESFKEEALSAVDDNYNVIVFPSPRSRRLCLSDGGPDEATAEKSGGHAGAQQKTKETHMDELEKALADLKAANDRLAAQDAELAKLKERLAALAEKYPEEGIELSDGDPRMAMLLKQLRENKRAALVKAASGKLPRAKQGLVARLADSLSLGLSIELADGEAKRKVSQIDLVTGIFEEIPPMVKTGTLDLSDGEEKQADLTGLMGCV
ncbi:MAG: hypothetical protein LBI86_09695 [Treponema sp.]|nr:hypothetical protein [Treponema sp.]